MRRVRDRADTPQRSEEYRRKPDLLAQAKGHAQSLNNYLQEFFMLQDLVERSFNIELLREQDWFGYEESGRINLSILSVPA
ncbi:hypothetical protein [Pontibacter rugosus]|uniref:Uncharacterized protein n=1 Tax=Pontibacter rugosus TaxID=1745966 RepID=A0ABW3SIW1_9BACT